MRSTPYINGMLTVPCPSCGGNVIIRVSDAPTRLIRCTEEVEGPDRKTKKRCNHKLMRMEWEWLAEQAERKVTA